MVNLWLGVAALLVVALLFIWLPLIRRQSAVPETQADRNAQNVTIFKTRLAELEKELADNNLDQPSFDELKDELEKNLLEEVGDATPVQAPVVKSFPLAVPLILTLLIPVAAVFYYLSSGYSQPLAVALERGTTAPASQQLSAQAQQQILQLKARLEAEPEDPEGWFLLARTFVGVGRYAEAFDAFKVVTRLIGEHPAILSQQAQALYYQNQSVMTPDVQVLLDKAVALDPLDPSLLGFTGIIAYDQGEYQQAIDEWQKAINSGRPEVNQQGLQMAVNQAKAQIEAAGGTAIIAQPASVGGPQIQVSLSMAPQLAGKVNDDTVVFLIAQAVDGPPMPLAAKRMAMKQLPTEVTLDDSLAMAPMAKLSTADQVMVKAIVSFSGTAGAKPGDFIGSYGPIKISADTNEQVDLVIDQVVE